jgi:hypothetical protein
MIIHRTVAVGIMLLQLFTTGQVAAEELIDAKKPAAILNIAKGFGSAKLGTDSEGDPLITGRIKGTKYGIYFYGCNSKGEDCDDIQFNAAWSGVKTTLQTINQWNAEKRYGKAYIDNEGDPVIQMTVNLDYGVSDENLDDTFNWWTKALDEFIEEVVDKEPEKKQPEKPAPVENAQ